MSDLDDLSIPDLDSVSQYGIRHRMNSINNLMWSLGVQVQVFYSAWVDVEYFFGELSLNSGDASVFNSAVFC